MSEILNFKYFFGGISESEKVGQQGSFYSGEHLNIYDEATSLGVLPASVKVSGTTVTDLVKWIVSGMPKDTNKYFYGDTGNIYMETSAGVWSKLQETANSGGQGMAYHDNYIYYTQDTQIGRYGPLDDSPVFDDDWQTGLNDTSDTNLAPVMAFKEGLAVGHGNYLGWWDGSVWDDDRIVLPPGLEIRSLDMFNEFIVIGTWRGSKITDDEEGYLFFWDGISETFNYFTNIPEGGINGLVNTKNRIFSVIGSSGALFLNYEPFEKIHQIPRLTLNQYLEVLPGAITNWKNLVHIGVSGGTNSSNVKQGIYTWGSKSKLYPEVLNFAHTISTGSSQTTDVKIGSVKGMGKYLYFGWQDGDVYGVDKVSDTGAPYSTATLELMIHDNDQMFNDKGINTIKVVHSPLLTGESITIGYKIDRASSYTTGDANSTVGSTETRLNVNDRYVELQVECIIGSSATTSPTVRYVGFEFDPLAEETDY